MSYANPFAAIALIAEERIARAEQAGELRNLPGQGRPLLFEDDSHIPEDMRLAYKILRNSDYLAEKDAHAFSVTRALKEAEMEEASGQNAPAAHPTATMHGKLSRLYVMLARVRKRQGRDIDLLDRVNIQDSPYLSGLLDRI